MSYADGHPVRLVGGRLGLDFLNTADWSQEGSVIHEKLESDPDVRIWAKAARADHLRLEPANVLREFRAKVRPAVAGSASAPHAVELLNAVLRDCDSPVVKITSGGRTTWASAIGLVQVVSLSLVNLLCDEHERDRLKMCPGRDCGWFFLDDTRNRRRRWCMMETCGNRAKVRRLYARRKRRQD